MANLQEKKFWVHRPLLTDTLPYEVPVIFSNDTFYRAISREHDPVIAAALSKMTRPSTDYTIPYSYQVRKDDSRFTTLGIIHPLLQVEFCKFYFRSEGALLAYTSRSEYSIRHPTAVAAVYVERSSTDPTGVEKLGQVEAETQDGEPELERMVSYFVYGRYNLLSKFYESSDFVRLEKKFSLLRHLDISKCFYSIYTHTISWAVKDRRFAKAHRNAYSFEAEFDKLMQHANYNETNGIVVGPEVSRVFSEIILQDVDRKVAQRLRNDGLYQHQHYSVTRYVDDYSIFSNSEDILDKIEACLRSELETYKLYLNDAKRQDYSRPFISTLSIARSDLTVLMAQARAIFDSKPWSEGKSLRPSEKRNLQALIHELRVIVRRNDTQFGYISGWAIGNLRVMIRSVHTILKISKDNHDVYDDWYQAISTLLGCAFYLTAVDLRVRTTYSLCQVLLLIYRERKNVPDEYFEQLDYMVSSELSSIVRSVQVSNALSMGEESVELYNLLISGAYVIGPSFVRNSGILDILGRLVSSKLTYFKYITAKFCYLRDAAEFATQLEALNLAVESLVVSHGDVVEDSQQYMLFCDFLSSPDITQKRKREMYERIWGGTIPNQVADDLGGKIGFADWKAMDLEHTLRRKQLRPVYGVA